MSYRADLEAAHRRIAALEAALIEKHGALPEELLSEAKPKPVEALTVGKRIRSAWPLLLLVGLVYWFVNLTTISTSEAAKSGYVLFAIVGALILVARFIVNVARSGKSSMLQRIMLVASLPLLLPAAFDSLNNAGFGLGALAILFAGISGAVHVARWIRIG